MCIYLEQQRLLTMIDIYLFLHRCQHLVRFLCECYEKWRGLTFFL